MRILLAGHKGQLGRTLLPLLEQAGHSVSGVDLPDMDITDRTSLAAMAKAFRPDLVLNSAALTNVNLCAEQPELAYRANGLGAQNLALIAAELNAEFMQISTNEVFDGESDQAYHEWATRNPINPYGVSKRAGEYFTEHLCTQFYIVRTAWLYAAGGRNFPHVIIEAADKRGKLRVVTDEVGSPTYVIDLAEAIVKLLDTHAYGVYHLVNAGIASRYDFAKEIIRLSGREHIEITPILASEWERASTPPAYAPLANNAAKALGITLRPWQQALAEFLKETGYAK